MLRVVVVVGGVVVRRERMGGVVGVVRMRVMEVRMVMMGTKMMVIL